VTIEVGHIHRAAEIMGMGSFSVWDALILAAAESARCSHVYSEDMQHGYQIAGMTVVNPFRQT